MKQAGPEFLTGVEFNQEKVSQTGEFSTEPTFYNHLNRVRVSVTTPEHSLHRYTLTSELRARLRSFPWRVSLPCSDRKYQVSLISNPTNHLENKAQLCTAKQSHLSPSLGNSWERSQKTKALHNKEMPATNGPSPISHLHLGYLGRSPWLNIRPGVWKRAII